MAKRFTRPQPFKLIAGMIAGMLVMVCALAFSSTRAFAERAARIAASVQVINFTHSAKAGKAMVFANAADLLVNTEGEYYRQQQGRLVMTSILKTTLPPVNVAVEPATTKGGESQKETVSVILYY